VLYPTELRVPCKERLRIIKNSAKSTVHMTESELTHWMEHALVLAERAALQDEVPVGAVLVSSGNLLSEGYNQREQTQKAVAHAEVQALEAYSLSHKQWRVPPQTSLIVTAEPCLMCTGALLWARVENIFYGCSDPKNAGFRRIQPFIQEGVYDHKFQTVQNGILEAKCSALLSGYFKKKRGQ
jgi:tRNA(adenine34) deaminase